MIDKAYSTSSYLALRFTAKPDTDFAEGIPYRYPEMPSDTGRIMVRTANDIDEALQSQLDAIKSRHDRIGLLLSGGMDSGILASYLSGADAYTFRFLAGTYQQDELHRAEHFASINSLNLHYVDINWNTVCQNLNSVMRSKGGPVHSIEPQICQAARQATADGIDIMIIGDASDYIFGGMDRLLSRDWSYNDFIRRYIYIDPFEVLADPRSIEHVFEPYRKGESIDYIEVLEKLSAQESYGSYDNAFKTARLPYFDPYEKLKIADNLDLTRIRSGESKYLIRDLFKMRYPGLPVPDKLPMPRPVDSYFASWQGPTRPEFKKGLAMSRFNGNQKWLIWCLEQFLNLING